MYKYFLVFFVVLFIVQKSFSQSNVFEYNRHVQLALLFSNSQNIDTNKLAISHLDSAIKLGHNINPFDYLRIGVLYHRCGNDSLFYKNLSKFFASGYKRKDFKKNYIGIYKNLNKQELRTLQKLEKRNFSKHKYSLTKRIRVFKILLKDSFVRRFLRSKQKRNLNVKNSIEKYLKKYGNLPYTNEIGEELQNAFINVVINHQIQFDQIQFANQYFRLFQDGVFYNLELIMWCLDRYSINKGVVFDIKADLNSRYSFIIDTTQLYFNNKTGYKQSFGFISLYNNSKLIIPVFDFIKTNTIREKLGYPNLKLLPNYSEDTFIKIYGQFDNKNK